MITHLISRNSFSRGCVCVREVGRVLRLLSVLYSLLDQLLSPFFDMQLLPRSQRGPTYCTGFLPDRLEECGDGGMSEELTGRDDSPFRVLRQRLRLRFGFGFRFLAWPRPRP